MEIKKWGSAITFSILLHGLLLIVFINTAFTIKQTEPKVQSLKTYVVSSAIQKKYLAQERKSIEQDIFKTNDVVTPKIKNQNEDAKLNENRLNKTQKLNIKEKNSEEIHTKKNNQLKAQGVKIEKFKKLDPYKTSHVISQFNKLSSSTKHFTTAIAPITPNSQQTSFNKQGTIITTARGTVLLFSLQLKPDQYTCNDKGI